MTRNARRGVFFNLDGILADSAVALRVAFERFAAPYGALPSGSSALAEISGLPLPIAVAALKRQWALPQGLDELMRRYAALTDAAYLDIHPARAAAATLEAAFRNGWAVGIVTSQTATRTRAWLARTRLAQFVDIVVGGDEVCLGKPEPEPYRTALARSGCARELSLAVEDAPNGAKSALAAGIRSYGVADAEATSPDWPDGVRLIGALDELIPELERQHLRRVAGGRR
ncbi:MAG TPA: HAD family phosphatase [Stellaceae bacterium]|nr:HAD family phosphatase [Stellaceae bacterium]